MDPELFSLNGKKYLRAELLQLCSRKIKEAANNEDEVSLYSFIYEWLSPSPVIDAVTSGSTGAPKRLSFGKQQATESARMTCSFLDITENMNLLLCLPAKYIAGKMMVVRAFTNGANLVTVPPSGNPLTGLADSIDFAAMVPLQVKQAISEPSTLEKFRSINNVIIGGAALPPSLEDTLASFPNRIYSTFAMTETLSHIALRRISGEGRSDLYELLNGVSISRDSRDCMVVSAPHIAAGPIVTNDVIAIKKEGYFQWLGRYDNVINSGGVKIYPEQLEASLAHLLPNRRFFIAALPDETLGQKTVMIVEGREPEISGEQKQAVAKLSGRYAAPKEYIYTGSFAETPNGKVNRKETLEAALNGLRLRGAI